MNCSKCGALNNVDSKFCINCGQSLENSQINMGQTEPIKQEELIINPTGSNTESVNNFQTNVNPYQSMNNQNVQSVPNISFMNYFFIILAVILKPFTAFKEELNKFNSFKNSAIISLIVSAVATLIKLITSMYNAVAVKSFDWSSGGYKTTWTWEKLKDLEYLELIGKNFLIYLGVIAAIAFAYYIASLIVKKQSSFPRLLGIAAVSIVPMIVCTLVLSPLLSLISIKLSMPVIIIGVVYTIILIYEGINNELLLDGNMKYYFNLICFSILGVAAYYLYMKMFIGSVSGELENIMDLFG